MKPWFNTALILALTLIWVVIALGLHGRLQNLEAKCFNQLQLEWQGEKGDEG